MGSQIDVPDNREQIVKFVLMGEGAGGAMSPLLHIELVIKNKTKNKCIPLLDAIKVEHDGSA